MNRSVLRPSILVGSVIIVGGLLFLRPAANLGTVSGPLAYPSSTPAPKRNINAERAFFGLKRSEAVVLWDQRVTGVVGPDRKAVIAVPITEGGSIGSTRLGIFDVDTLRPFGSLEMNGSIQKLAIADGRLSVWVSDYQPTDEYHRPSFFKKTVFAMHGRALDAIAFAREPNPSHSAEPLLASVATPAARPRSATGIVWDPVTPAPSLRHHRKASAMQGVSTGMCDDESIESVSDDGEVITTIEGHHYEVEAGDQATASVWVEASDLLICETSSGLKLINKDDNESVLASRL